MFIILVPSIANSLAMISREFEGWIGESDDFESLRRQRFNHNIMARCIARSKRLSIKRTTRSNTLIDPS